MTKECLGRERERERERERRVIYAGQSCVHAASAQSPAHTCDERSAAVGQLMHFQQGHVQHSRAYVSQNSERKSRKYN